MVVADRTVHVSADEARSLIERVLLRVDPTPDEACTVANVRSRRTCGHVKALLTGQSYASRASLAFAVVRKAFSAGRGHAVRLPSPLRQPNRIGLSAPLSAHANPDLGPGRSPLLAKTYSRR
jgi:hypothetical protein